MFDLDRIIDLSPFSLAKAEKQALYAEALSDLTRHHYDNCLPYRRILDVLGFDPTLTHPAENVPFIPVRLFKEYELASVDRSQIIKTMTSSGTSGQSVSKIFLDRATATLQTKVLTKITSHFTGPKRLPMLVIDAKSVLKDRHMFSARGAGILGFSMMGRDVTYALDDQMQLDWNAVEAFCEKYQGEPVLLFGFTHMIWEYFYKTLAASTRRVVLDQGILIHGGGWKKLNDQAVDNATYKRRLKEVCGIQKLHNYYGMVEQTGSIFMECDAGHLHCSIFSDIVVRNTHFAICEKGESGLVQLMSLLPHSYPGHVVLSEDVGEILGEDDCPCGRLGKYFRIYGRVQNAEMRGCSDTHVQ